MSELAIVLAVIILAGAFGGVVSVLIEHKSKNDSSEEAAFQRRPSPIEFLSAASMGIATAFVMLLVLEVGMNGFNGIWNSNQGLLFGLVGDRVTTNNNSDVATIELHAHQLLLLFSFCLLGAIFAYPVLDLAGRILLRGMENRLATLESKYEKVESRSSSTMAFAEETAEGVFEKPTAAELSNVQYQILLELRESFDRRRSISALGNKLKLSEREASAEVEELVTKKFVKMEDKAGNVVVRLLPRGVAALTVAELTGG